MIHFENSEDFNTHLNKFHPTHVILLDPKLEYFRGVEIYNARENLTVKNFSLQNFKLKTYYFIYKDSSEKFHYLHQIQKEKMAFDRIVISLVKIYRSNYRRN